MMLSRLLGAIALLTVPAIAVAAEDAPTVQSLISDGFVAVGSFASQIGPGIFLQKMEKLYLCFVAEKPGSADVKTQYCKPVH